MRPEDMRSFLDRRPFEPFRIHISSGQTVDVTHPKAAIVSCSLFAVAVSPKNGVGEYLIHYNPLHVVKIEPLLGNRRRGGNGRRKT
jgi:hypothetical protein